jgi:hypothetical protein
MNVQDSKVRKIDDALRNDLSVANHNHQIGLESAELLEALRPANSFRLKYRNAKAQCGLFDRRFRQLLASALWSIRLCENSEN